jgi:precorrin-6B methylase 2
MTTNWKEYYEKIGNSSPRPLLVEAVKKCERHVAVLDIGAGSMADSIYLLQKNFGSVVAIDSSESFSEITKETQPPHLETYNIKIEEYSFSKKSLTSLMHNSHSLL